MNRSLVAGRAWIPILIAGATLGVVAIRSMASAQRHDPGDAAQVVAAVLAAEPAGWDVAASDFRRSTDLRRGTELIRQLAKTTGTEPGVQLALALVPESIDADTAADLLVDWLRGRRAFGMEAALALGRTGRTRAAAAVVRMALEAEREWSERAGLVAALCRLDDPRKHADLVRAALLAGTPYVDDVTIERFALPSPARQALERTVILDALRKSGVVPLDLLEAVDPDAPWPRLAATVDAVHAVLVAAGTDDGTPR
jgi:hypothetical protein